MRTLTGMVLLLPRRSNSPSCNTRSSLLCSSKGSSPISSRKREVPSASSTAEGVGSGKVPLFVSEKLAFNQIGRQRGAIDLNQRAVFISAGVVHGPGNQFLAGAGLPRDQHGGVGRCHLFHFEKSVFERIAVADNRAEVEFYFDFILQVGGFTSSFQLRNLRVGIANFDLSQLRKATSRLLARNPPDCPHRLSPVGSCAESSGSVHPV